MRRGRQVLAVVLVVAGLAIAAYPFLSVSRLQQQVLDEVPFPGGPDSTIEGVTDNPLFDGDFRLAFRGVGASIDDVDQTLLDAGFERSASNSNGDSTFIRACCGAYDAVVVTVFEGRDGLTGMSYSVTDSDIVATWYFITGFGLIVAFGGMTMAAFAVGRDPKTTAGALSDQTPVSAS